VDSFVYMLLSVGPRVLLSGQSYPNTEQGPARNTIPGDEVIPSPTHQASFSTHFLSLAGSVAKGLRSPLELRGSRDTTLMWGVYLENSMPSPAFQDCTNLRSDRHTHTHLASQHWPRAPAFSFLPSCSEESTLNFSRSRFLVPRLCETPAKKHKRPQRNQRRGGEAWCGPIRRRPDAAGPSSRSPLLCKAHLSLCPPPLLTNEDPVLV
jgi:hypothetical protein